MNILWILLATGLVLLVQSIVFGRLNLRRLRYGRTFSRTHLFAGEEAELVETLENHKWLPVPWLRVESRMPPSLRFGAQQNLRIEGERYHCSVFFLRPYERIVRRHKVTAMARGYFDLSSVALTGGDLFGMSQQSTQKNVGLRLTVYPRLLSPEELTLPSSRFQGELPVKRWILPDPFLYGGIREYRAGDPQRDIHWRASARTGTLQVMQRDYTASPRLMVLINIQITEHQWNRLNEQELPVIEHAISMGATMLLYALEHGVEAGLASNASAEENGPPLLVLPAASSGQRELLLDALARLRTERVKSFHTFLDELPSQTGMDYAILTAYISPALEQRAQWLRARGNSVLFIPVEQEVNAREVGA